MKTMKAFCTTTVLVLTLSVSAFGGDIAAPGAVLPGEPGIPGATAPVTTGTDGPVDSGLDAAAWGEMLMTLLSLF